MFCPKCGTQITPGSAFCQGCGNPVSNQNAGAQMPVYQQNVPMQQPIYQQNAAINTPNNYQANGNQDLQQLYSAQNYAGALQPYLDEIERLNDLKKQKSTNVVRVITAAVLTALFGILMGVFLSSGGFVKIFGYVLIFFTATAAIMLVICIIMLIATISKFPPNGVDNEIQRLYGEFDAKLAADVNLQSNFRVFQGLFPYGATYKQVNFMIQLIETRRANNFQDALNLYDQHVHMENMERLADEQNQIAREIANSAARTAAAAEQTAKNSYFH